ncbi:hypothetical protein H4R19_006375, partial [Coemansia spiralis]
MLDDLPPPRPRPGKEGILQRRARNTIASRAALQFTTPSTFIPLPGSWAELPPPPPPPPPTAALERTLAMRSEPEFRRYLPAGSSNTWAAGRLHDPRSGSGSGSSSGSSNSSGAAAVPISRLLPRTTANAPQPASMSRAVTAPHLAVVLTPGPGFGDRDSGHASERRAGLDQPVPTLSDRDEDLKQRGPSTTHAQPRPGSATDTDTDSPATGAQGSSADAWPDRDAGTVPGRSRLSVVSHMSSLAESVRVPAASIARPIRHRRLPQISQHSRKVATRLLMRAGLSRIAIRVATSGAASADQGAGAGSTSASTSCVFESGEAMASSAASGVDLDPNGLRSLKAERRKQVKFVDEFGFMHFEGSGAQEAEQAEHYAAWRAQSGSAAKVPCPRLDVREGSEAKWSTLLESFDAAALRTSRKVKRLVQAGVAPAARPRYYYVLSGAAALEQPGEYARLTGLPALAIYDVIE